MAIKGFTVHQENAQGNPLCGRRLNRRGYLGKPNVNASPRFVTCPDCQKKLKDLHVIAMKTELI